ncbi:MULTISPECIES: pyridoxamine 5'-phosphate oxidase family protein [Micrococcaceae]|uniref:pyridoxamine 5'-phosphate oxidase family protein n=1 Tax=Micrococcaceae TaxID=1268 RepID=UPI000DCB19F3|nr:MULTISPECIES: pyridoxamine 5'-phosphate oxidase family protein [Micrococcaceae]RAX48658.1 pyridoxamine 5'-phosphate oxidase family protein [Arthrobacter sp. AQ5-05]
MRENSLVPKTEILTAGQCWKLLSETSVGRLAVSTDGAPDVFPVNYKVDGESLLFRTGGGSKFTDIKNDARVALEADSVSGESGRAWSVVIRGRVEISTSPDPILETVGRGLFPWQGIGKDHLVRILPEKVTGRRFTLEPSTTWKVPLDEATRAGLE